MANDVPAHPPRRLGAPSRIALVDTDEAVHHSVCDAFKAHAPQWQLESYLNPRLALQIIPRLRPLPAAVLLAIQMPKLSGIDFARQIKATLPHAAVLMYSARADCPSILHSIRAGATGYLTKPAAPEQLVRAVQEALAGHYFFSAHAQDALAIYLQRLPIPDIAQKLSPRELEIMQLVAASCPYKEIASSLRLSPGTIPAHMRRIFRKLHVHRRAEAVRAFLFRRPQR